MPLKISIITVTYNSEKFLQSCITSIQNQDYPHIEHIIVDGKSTDGTLGIIKANAGSISKWISETDRGMYDAINKGMQLATGDIIGLLNSDDLLASTDVVSTIAKTFEEKQVDSLYADLLFVQQDDMEKVYRTWKSQNYKRNRFRYGWMPAHPTFYFKRSLLEKYGGYENHFFSAADYEFMARYLFVHKVSSYHVPKMFVKMRIGGASNGNLYQRLRANRRDYLAMKKNNIPCAFAVSILKPLIKLHQYKFDVKKLRAASFFSNW